MFPYKIRAKKSLGQNFLIDENALLDIAEAIPVQGNHIIEVGPGYGALTKYLISQDPASLDLVELDSDLIIFLKTEFPQTTIYHQDVLKFIPPYERYSVIANIPYYITSPILFHFLYHLPHSPEAMVIMMQKEVGEKILAGRARKPHHSLLSLAVEEACEDIEAIRYVGNESFHPKPKVDSIVLRFFIKKNRNRNLEKMLIQIWEKAFTHPRKTLVSNLNGYTSETSLRKWMEQCGYDTRIRAEAVKKEDWEKLL